MRNEHELLRLAEQLEQDVFETLGLEFDMRTWHSGNSYCPIGFHIAFNETRLKFFGTEDNLHRRPIWNGVYEYEALTHYYDIPEHKLLYMFSGYYYTEILTNDITPAMVATRIRKVIQE